jgi:catechol 2,3-dioxygenase-like lactoylglutathione lyase family enzyme
MAPEWTHIWLLVESMPTAKRFYQETLGLEIISDLGVFVELKANPSCQLSLFERDAMLANEPAIPLVPVGGQHGVIAFAVEALDSFCDGLRAKGVELVSAETNHPEWGLRTAFLYDPDGNLLCLYSGIPESGPQES